MKESRLFLDFLKNNFLLLFLPVLLGLVISIYLYSTANVKAKLSQAYKMEYSSLNINTSLALADQAVMELRLLEFGSLYPNSKVIIYKGAPLIVNIEVLTDDKNTGFELLLKETEYLKKNFTVSTLTQVHIEQVEPDIFRYILTGLILSFLVGLISSLTREYFKNY